METDALVDFVVGKEFEEQLNLDVLRGLADFDWISDLLRIPLMN